LLLTVALGLLTVAGLTGCESEPFCFGCVAQDAGGGGTRPDGFSGNGDGSDCVPTPEICNGMDDDCNGIADDGTLADVGGECGSSLGICKKGMLVCDAGVVVCQGEVPPEAELCDGIDNDCDGVVDNGNPGGAMLCGISVGDCTQGRTACVGGQVVCQGGIGPMPEVCDGRDNDCDGDVDNGDPGGGGTCGSSVGTCTLGMIRCVGGQLACIGQGPSLPELCNGFDDNCNGTIDEGFDLASDLNNCGQCGKVCTLGGARAACRAGSCVVDLCTADRWDLDSDPTNGCEYSCVFRGAELCNGIDDNCDGRIDEGLSVPDLCPQVGACIGTQPTCQGAMGWVCVYGPNVSTNAQGQIIPETNCDDLDNDCNGKVDDLFPLRSSTCTAGTGACMTTGTRVCNATRDGLDCTAPVPPMGSPEVCNGIDDDCDGLVDNAAPDDWANITVGSATKKIYRYEASRPDATAIATGTMDHRSCSSPNRQPWINVTYPEALAACTAAGARLCTEAEWQAACQVSTTSPCTWSENTACTVYRPGVCNDLARDSDPTLQGIQTQVQPTGSLPACYSDWGGVNRVYDLSGNVKEWTQARSPGINPLRGGAASNPKGGTTCTSNFTVADDTFLFTNVGFRCCKD
jgi:hypothetical protein